jgi:hypothetical protein
MSGKKAKCKKCGHAFVLSALSETKAPASAKASSAKAAAPVAKKSPADSDHGPKMYGWLSEDENQKLIEGKAAAPAPSEIRPKYEDVSKNPYGLTQLDESLRCPFCAKEMETDAVVCLHCGYNTQNRTHGKITRTYANTGSEQFMWSLPGIIAIVAIFAFIGVIVYLWTMLPDPNSKEYREVWWKDFIRAGQVWGSILSGFLIAGALFFAVKRLILNPKPPEKEKK